MTATTWHDRLTTARADARFLRYLAARGLNAGEIGGGTLLGLYDAWRAPWYTRLATRLLVPPIHALTRLLQWMAQGRRAKP